MATHSILNSVKESLGINSDYDVFDDTIIMHINTVFGILKQLGIGPSDGFSISDSTSEWSDFLGEDDSNLQMVKTYMCDRVRKMFDPPTGSAVSEALNQDIDELSFRLSIEGDYTNASNRLTSVGGDTGSVGTVSESTVSLYGSNFNQG